MRALGPKKVFGLLMPERDSSSQSKSRGQILAEHLGIEYIVEDIAPTLEAIGCYRWRDEAIRKTIEYFHAYRLNYAVVGTPNRLEYDQGFFVKNGDGSADIKPIAHLYKTQVYGMARHFGLPDEITSAVPTTNTYSLPQGQDEFYFALPYDKMDLALWAFNHDRPAAELAEALGITETQAEAIYKDILNKRRTTEYMYLAPLLIEDVPLRW